MSEENTDLHGGEGAVQKEPRFQQMKMATRSPQRKNSADSALSAVKSFKARFSKSFAKTAPRPKVKKA